jgi:hypothetical protein
METKAYLKQIGRLDRMIKNKIIELDQYRDLEYSLGAISNEERVQTTLNPDKFGNRIAKIEEMEKKIDNLIDAYVEKKEIIIKQIDEMENETYYQLLFSRYVEKKTFERIADEMNYCWRQIIRIHGSALQAFEKKYGEKYLKS